MSQGYQPKGGATGKPVPPSSGTGVVGLVVPCQSPTGNPIFEVKMSPHIFEELGKKLDKIFKMVQGLNDRLDAVEKKLVAKKR
jgi:hypothetical protein